MLSRITLRHKMAKINIKNFISVKKGIRLFFFNLESDKKGLKKVCLVLEVLQMKCLFKVFQSSNERLHAFCWV